MAALAAIDQEKNWSSTHTRGARRLIEGVLETDPEISAGHLIEANGLWPDPITLYVLGRFQCRRRDYEAAVSTLEMLEAARGRVYHLFFPGLVALGRLELAQALAALSRPEESLRLYKQVLDGWGLRAPRCSITKRARTGYWAQITKEEREHD